MTLNKTFAAVVVGTGFIGPVHVEALRRSGVHVAGIVGSSAEKSTAAAKSLGIPRGYDSLDQVLADSSVDAVHLASPNRYHFDQAAAVLRAGKHLMCEKPLAINSDQTSQLLRLSEQSDCVAGVAYNIRFYPLCHEAASRIATDDFGDTLHVNGSYVQDWLLKETDFNWRVMTESGGPLRAVADIGTHWLDLMQFITGQKIVSVCADLQTVHSHRQQPVGAVETFSGGHAGDTQNVPIETDDAANILLRFENGARGTLHVSQTTAGRKNCLRFEIAGSRQAIAFDSEQPNSLWIGHRDRANETLIRDPALMHNTAANVASYPGGHAEGFPDTFKQLFRSFYGYIAAADWNAPRPFPTFADGHREVTLCEAILESHRQRSWVDVAADHG